MRQYRILSGKHDDERPIYLSIPSYKKFWVMFDLDNGNELRGSYIWIFKTAKKAWKHREKQYKMKSGARLSTPIFVKPKKNKNKIWI